MYGFLGYFFDKSQKKNFIPETSKYLEHRGPDSSQIFKNEEKIEAV